MPRTQPPIIGTLSYWVDREVPSCLPQHLMEKPKGTFWPTQYYGTFVTTREPIVIQYC